MPPNAPDLTRFLTAQEPIYATALAELYAGRKSTHWMWFIFPQVKGLGRSSMSEYYGIGSVAEARAYVEHPVLGAHLAECVEVLLTHEGLSATDIMGSPDDLKLRSSLTLFSTLSNPGSLFHRALTRFFEGQPDQATLAILDSWAA